MSNTFQALLDEHFANLPKEGSTVSGTIIAIENGAVRIDIGGVASGIVRANELFQESAEYGNINIGDTVEAVVLEQENETGEVELSFRAAGFTRVWDRMIERRDTGVTFTAKPIRANKGGLMMQVDALVGFMPVSQLAPEHYPRVPGGDKNRIHEELKMLVGVPMQVKVLDANPDEEKLIVSEKAVWEDEQKAVLDAYEIGTIIEGEVSAITSFGAFVKFGEGLEGLVHISEIVWQRIDHPRDVLKVGDRVRAQIIDLDKSKIYLSMKRLVEDPWKSVKDNYKVGQVVEGEVHKIEPFGLMVKLDEDIHGLAHISELSNKAIKDTAELKTMFEVGKSYKFEIVNIEPAEHRLGLKVEGVKSKTEDSGEGKKSKKADKSETVEETSEEGVA
jgi:small subunit ribosomal protein S1